MRKAAWRAQAAAAPWNSRIPETTEGNPASSATVSEAEAERIGRVLTIAQRVGLPPPLAQDLVALWYRPVTTLNDGLADSMIELEPVSNDPVRRPEESVVARPSQRLRLVMPPLESTWITDIGQPTSEDVSPVTPQRWKADHPTGISVVRWEDLENDDEPAKTA